MIAHIDADSFFASVLVRTHPHLRGKPLFAIGMGGGCIIAATYEAKAKGVKTGMRLSEARALCPGAVEMAADFRETGLASEQIESVLKNVCPRVEQTSIDEWYLDLACLVGGLPVHAEAWAKDMQKSILENAGLSVSIGVAHTKLLAKMAGEYRKPAGVTVVEKKNREAFLRDRPAAAIPGIGPQRRVKTDAMGWKTAWDIASASDETLTRICGKPGVEMKCELLGQRLFEVTEDTRPPKSISRCRTFKGTTDLSLAKAHLLKHLEYCTMKMRRHGLQCTDVSVWLRTADFAYAGTHKKLPDASSTVSTILPTVSAAFSALTKIQRRWNQVGLALHGFKSTESRQVSLFEDPQVAINEENLQAAMDSLHARFGRDSLTRASALSVSSGTKREVELPCV